MARNVGLIDVGERSHSLIAKLVPLLNKLQGTFHFDATDPITLLALGGPDIEDSYDTAGILTRLSNHPPTSKYDCVIGVTHVPLATRDAPSGKVWSDYFSDSDLSKCGILTTHRRALEQKGSDRTQAQYVVYLMAELLLSIWAKRKVMHEFSDSCLFDQLEDKASLADAMRNPSICDPSKVTLKQANVPDSAIRDVERMLAWACRTPLGNILGATFTSAPVSLAGGLAAGWALTFVPAVSWPFIAVPTVVTVVIVAWRKAKGL